jgi:hypothetical protein
VIVLVSGDTVRIIHENWRADFNKSACEGGPNGLPDVATDCVIARICTIRAF